jgi:peptidoglycan/LPS O-acetylase OafA/YrhL
MRQARIAYSAAMSVVEAQRGVHVKEGGLNYRPHLDGLRAVAVYLVVAFHVGLTHMRGGFIGVDIFYVLSGFLVTRILFADLTVHGRLQWRRFYSRRVRRILPAAIVTLVVTALAYAAIATPSQSSDAQGGFRAACLYVANWYFIRQATDYFAPSATANPVLHFWSLAIEEQFYLLWPVVLYGLIALTRRAGRGRWWLLRGVIAAAGVASALAAWRIAEVNLPLAYYGTWTRAYQLLAGAVIAVTPRLFHLGSRGREVARWTAPAALAGLLVLATSTVDLGPISRGIGATVIASMLIVALENAERSRTTRALSTKPLRYLGRISYGTYLWHWPLVTLITHDHQFEPVALFLLVCPASTLLGALSYHFVEQPIRLSPTLGRYRTETVAIGLAASVVAGMVVMPAILDFGAGFVTAVGSPSEPTVAPRLLDWRRAKADLPNVPDCLDRPLERCTLVRGDKQRVLVIGDSHARMLMPMFIAIARRESLTLSVATYTGCAWQRGIHIVNPLLPDCPRRQADWFGRILPATDPDIVILIGKSYDDPRFTLQLSLPDGRKVDPGAEGYAQALVDASSSTIHSLQRSGRKVVIIEPLPIMAPFNPLDCLSTDRSPSECTFQTSAEPSRLEQFYRQAAGEPGVWSVDLDGLVCPRLPTCDPIVRDIIVWRDGAAHLTATFATALAPQVDEIFHRQGILDGS